MLKFILKADQILLNDQKRNLFFDSDVKFNMETVILPLTMFQFPDYRANFTTAHLNVVN